MLFKIVLLLALLLVPQVDAAVCPGVELLDSSDPARWEGMVRKNTMVKRSGDWSFELFGDYPTELISREMIPVDMNRTYILSAWMRSLDEEFPASAFFGLRMYDRDKRQITLRNIQAVKGTFSRLALDAPAGSREIIVERNDRWVGRENITVAMGAREDFSDLPNFYTAAAEKTEEVPGGVRAVLRQPLSRDYPSGTGVRIHGRHGAPFYWAASGWMPAEWKEVGTVLRGFSLGYASPVKFWPGTRYVRVFAWFGNYNLIPSEQARLLVDDISFRAPGGVRSAAGITEITPYGACGVSVVIENYLQDSDIPVLVELRVDGRRAGESRLRVPASGTSAADFHLAGPMSSEHSISASLKTIKPRNLPEDEDGLDFGPFLREETVDFAALRRVPFVDFPVAIDGDISKWKGLNSIFLSKEATSAEVYLAWDDENFYLAAEVEDEKHFNSREGSAIWNGDAVQFALVPKAAGAAPSNFGLALASGKESAFRWMGPETPPPASGEYAVIRCEDEKKTYYEIKIPFSRLGMRASPGALLGFNVVVFQDYDGQGYDYWMENTPGLAGGWRPHLFEEFMLSR